MDTAAVKAVPTVPGTQASPQRNRATLLGGVSVALVLGLGAAWWSQTPKRAVSNLRDNVPQQVTADAAVSADGANTAPPLASSIGFVPLAVPSTAATATATATATTHATTRLPFATGGSAKATTSSAPSALPSAPTHIR